MPQASKPLRKISFAVIAIAILLPIANLIISILAQRWRTIAIVAIPVTIFLWFGSHLLRHIEILFARFARRRALAIISVAALAFAASAMIAASKGAREPEVTDEFSYLLAADTYARGRLSNPVHPMWTHFESIHVIHEPTYASKYPPGQGMILAAGKLIAGHPIFGVWMSIAVACGAICWMLMAWVPPRWAIMGGVMTLFHPMFIEWSQSYWGGAVAMAGGALVAGALRRILRHQRVRDSLALGAGLIALANTRPYEGMVLSLAAGVVLLIKLYGRLRSAAPRSIEQSRATRDPRPYRVAFNVALPIVGVLALTALWIGYYNLRVTGDPLKLPYAVHEEKYGIAPLFLFQKLKPEPEYNHREIRELHAGWELTDYLNQQSMRGAMEAVRYKLKLFLEWNLRDLIFLIPLFALPVSLMTDRRVRLALIIIAITLAAVLLETWFLPHYTSLLAGLMLVPVVRSMMRLIHWRWRGLTVGRQTIRATVVLSAIMLMSFWYGLSPVDSSQWNYQRARMIEEFQASGDRHLVIVRYGPEHLIYQEWVHNEADIDRAPVVWARSMGERDRELIEYFRDRRVWMLEVNDGQALLKPYSNDSTNDARH